VAPELRSGTGADNTMEIRLPSREENVGVVRVAVAAFASGLPFTLPELEELRVAVSEAAGNVVLHAYPGEAGEMVVRARIADGALTVEVSDSGRGIADVAAARRPEFTTSTDPEHLGLGFTFMEQFSDTLEVDSAPGRGTRVRMTKRPHGSAGSSAAAGAPQAPQTPAGG
jgi:stage II sporulation protein AB (anti-sigma F factor)